MGIDISEWIDLKEVKRNYDWASAEVELGFQYPLDFKEFVDKYGCGGFNEFLWIITPFSEYDSVNVFKKMELLRRAYSVLQSDNQSLCKYKLYDERGEGLFPWGVTDNGDELFWLVDHGKRTIVVISSRYDAYEIYEYSFLEYIYKLFSKDIESKIYPDDFIQENNFYNE